MDTANLIEYEFSITDITKITKLLNSVRSKFGKSITTEFTRFTHSDMVYEHTMMSHKKQVKTYIMQAINTEYPHTRTKKCIYKKTRIPYHMFPCTHQLNQICYISRVAFCIHHNVYMNFDMCMSDGFTEPFTKVYINVNLDNKVDNAIIRKAVDSIMAIVETIS
jgi:hypothetical protein